MTFAEELEILLKKEEKALKKLLEIAYEKTNIITENNIEGLNEILKKEENLINEIGLLEVERMTLLDTWGVKTTTPISSVIENLPDKKEDIIHISTSMGEILEKLARRNDLNNDLIQENLDWIDFNMNLITSIEAPTSYGKDENQEANKERKTIFDRKV